VRAALPYLEKSEFREYDDHIRWFQDGGISHAQAMAMFCTPMNSDSSWGSPSSSNMAITS
jgi:hypothetical protein